ncbi:hypothetical protein Y032_0559g3454 [Ancylostoma ceylanicum]|uniref:Uncharacterized protein n=1 Tax=Ancylostoma ceylanicum TaxID=53326 RepID=A0A016WPX1_9BILA|nr:hypothetical protein Y032_0559g3454 [Ancylostoma ceylanicum]
MEACRSRNPYSSGTYSSVEKPDCSYRRQLRDDYVPIVCMLSLGWLLLLITLPAYALAIECYGGFTTDNEKPSKKSVCLGSNYCMKTSVKVGGETVNTYRCDANLCRVRLPLYSSRSIAVSVAAVVDNGDRRSRPSPLSSTAATDRRRCRRQQRPTVAVVDPDRRWRRQR